MAETRTRPTRAEPHEVLELKRIKATQPELAPAVDLQIALFDLQRRVQARVPMPSMDAEADCAARETASGRPLLRFEDIPLDWTDFRLVFRQTADVLRRFEALEAPEYQAIQAMSRDGHALEPHVVRWFDEAAAPGGAPEPAPPLPAGIAAGSLDQVLALAMRPFLQRCAEMFQTRADLLAWPHPHCPLCGGEPEFGVRTTGGDRLLVCGRCTARWGFDARACPFCRNDDRELLHSFASRDGLYRLDACDVCRRYLKSYDARRGGRPLMLAADSVATLTLDAAAMQKGYRG